MPNPLKLMMAAAGAAGGGSYYYRAAISGKLFVAGRNNHGQLGTGTVVPNSSPIQLGSRDWIDVVGIKLSSGGITSDGKLWTWGEGDSGVNGQGNVLKNSSPIQVGALTDWKRMWSSSTGNTVHAIKTDGTLWGWGNNASGMIGAEIYGNQSSPVQVGSLTDWVKISAGGGFTLALKSDGTLWSWGSGSYGKTGHGNTTSYSSPVQVGTETDWINISASSGTAHAIRGDGSLWVWGAGEQGRLGNNTSNVALSSPTQLGAATWSLLPGGLGRGAGTVFVINGSGQLFGWGYNSNGSAGTGDTIVRSSPTAVGSLTDWTIIQNGSGPTTGAIKSDGTFWTWGASYYGNQMHGDVVARSSPNQVGSLTTWKWSGGGSAHRFAIK